MYQIDFDYETRSTQDLTRVGIYNYCRHPDTEIISIQYSIDKTPVKLWKRSDGEFPEEVLEAFRDPLAVKIAYNVPFEFLITWFKLGIKIPIDEWIDVQVMARNCSLPGYLEDVGEILNIEHQKIKQRVSENSLIKLFCVPYIPEQATPLFGVTDAIYKDQYTNPVEWLQFEEYGCQDVRAEQEIMDRLSPFDLPRHEWEFWYLDQEINLRGLPIDMELVDGAIKVVDAEKDILTEKLKQLSGVDNPNSDQQLLEVLRNHGYPFSKLGKAFVKRAQKGEGNLDDVAKNILELRGQLSKSSVQKFSVFKTMTSEDGFLRYQFSFMGAPRTGRYASRGINLQNLARPDKEINENIEEAIELLKTGDHALVKAKYDNVIDMASSVLRPVFRAPADSRFVIADLNAIENRALGWLSGCSAILEVFEKGLCPYKSFAVELYKKPYDEITKEERNNAKPAVLGAGYRLSGGEEITDSETGDTFFTGLLGYAQSLGISLTKELADKAVYVFRKKYKEVKQYWYDLEDAFIRAVRDGETVTVGQVTFFKKENMLCVTLPSGRNLHYMDARIEENVPVHTTNSKGEPTTYYKTAMYYMGVSAKTHQWVEVDTHGGKLCENLCQAVSRDILMEGIKRAEEKGLDVRAHVHDEIICLVPYSSDLTVEDLESAMADPIEWAPDLPLKAEGFESEFYRKN